MPALSGCILVLVPLAREDTASSAMTIVAPDRGSLSSKTIKKPKKNLIKKTK